ncbi:hypothetical protein A2Z33_04730 [Candidatus Gottesmanbacteria bacterium RBG_16_52_11]|uniref:Uncharacterized protein n=1 Tax=Candidatus Gottesmanbacteria bacterium RBG_16_52_11 TaxID=1798374 RepID=A0A1F5YUH1_9BACT|nr:MAG: hypothetical protein A2Z33_04730 [Candidatus Gottesmanbacteria bacterium RBG_16_52_11]
MPARRRSEKSKISLRKSETHRINFFRKIVPPVFVWPLILLALFAVVRLYNVIYPCKDSFIIGICGFAIAAINFIFVFSVLFYAVVYLIVWFVRGKKTITYRLALSVGLISGVLHLSMYSMTVIPGYGLLSTGYMLLMMLYFKLTGLIP